MANLQEDWQAHYSDMPFEVFAEKVRQKFYPDMDPETFAQKAGLKPAAPKEDYVRPSPVAGPAVQDWGQFSDRMGKVDESLSEFRAPAPDALQQRRMMAAQELGQQHGLDQNLNGAGGTYGRNTANTFSLGLGNVLEAADPRRMFDPTSFGERHEFIEGADAGRAEANPKAALAGTLTGGLAQAAVMPSMGARSLAGRVGEGVVQGGSLGAGEAAVDLATDYTKDRASLAKAGTTTALGAAGGAAGGAIGHGIGSMVGGRVARKTLENAAPSVEALESGARAAFKEAERIGAIFRPDSITNRLAPEIMKHVDMFGKRISLATREKIFPGVGSVVDDMRAQSGRPWTLEDLHAWQQQLGAIVSKAATPKEKSLAHAIMGEIDDYIYTAAEKDMIGDANPRQMAWAFKQAKEQWAAMHRGRILQEAMENAGLSADAVGSGQNVQNALAQAYKSILKNKAARKAFSREEIAAIKRTVSIRGKAGALRLVGKMGPSGLSLAVGVPSMVAGIGSGVGIPGIAAGVSMYTVGYVARKLAEKTTRNAAEYASALARIPRSQQAAVLQQIANQGNGLAAQRARQLLTTLGASAGMGIATQEVAQ
jgi:hypothetical protein